MKKHESMSFKPSPRPVLTLCALSKPFSSYTQPNLPVITITLDTKHTLITPPKSCSHPGASSESSHTTSSPASFSNPKPNIHARSPSPTNSASHTSIAITSPTLALATDMGPSLGTSRASVPSHGSTTVIPAKPSLPLI
ncbi:MAG: hypothetical protein WDW38_007789 [Sanguina aurantia]